MYEGTLNIAGACWIIGTLMMIGGTICLGNHFLSDAKAIAAHVPPPAAASIIAGGFLLVFSGCVLSILRQIALNTRPRQSS